MKAWVIAVLFSIVTFCPVIAVAEDDTFDFGRSTRISVPFMQIPFGSGSDSDAVKKKEDAPETGEKDKEANRKEREKARMDKKIDDAIKKAWGNETAGTPDPQK